jgi:hypothetical protein
MRRRPEARAVRVTALLARVPVTQPNRTATACNGHPVAAWPPHQRERERERG